MINKYVQNMEKDGKPCESVLGDAHNVARLGAFYVNNSDLVLIAQLHCLLIHYQTESYTATENAAYRKGMDDLIDFFRRCGEEQSEKTLAKS